MPWSTNTRASRSSPGIGERSREGHELLTDMQNSGVLARTVLVYGQMNEPPGARWRVPLTALTIAEYFRDQKHQNVLLLMDNVFRFVQAGSEVSGLLGRLPSRVGYQPTLATEVAALQERIASVAGAAITAIQAVYVPADDFTDPAVTAISSHMDSVIMLSRDMAAEGFYPAIDPLASSSVLLDPLVVGAEHYAWPSGCARPSPATANCRTSSPCSASRSWARDDRLIVDRARRLQRFLTPAFRGHRGVHRQRRAAPCRWPTRWPAAARSSTARPTAGRRARSTWSATSTRRARGSGAEGTGRVKLLITDPDRVVADEADIVARARRGRKRRFRHSSRPCRLLTVLRSRCGLAARGRDGAALLRGTARRPDRQRRAGGRDRHPRGALPATTCATLEAVVLARFQADADAERPRGSQRTRLHMQAIRQIVRCCGRTATGAGPMTPDEPDGLVALGARGARRRRRRGGARASPPSAGTSAQVGVLGWMIVVPALLRLFLGPLARPHASAPAFSGPAPLLMLGLALGCWSAWQWMHRGMR